MILMWPTARSHHHVGDGVAPISLAGAAADELDVEIVGLARREVRNRNVTHLGADRPVQPDRRARLTVLRDDGLHIGLRHRMDQRRAARPVRDVVDDGRDQRRLRVRTGGDLKARREHHGGISLTR